MSDIFGLYAPEPFCFDLVMKPVMKRRSKGGIVKRKKGKYSDETKQKALELLKSGETAMQICADLGIKYSTLLLWKRNSQGFSTASKTKQKFNVSKAKVDADYIRALETELGMLKVYVEHLRNKLQIADPHKMLNWK